ncbi:MAG: glycosyltransferase [Clostridia bacterium]|nr:glycosyltransferase [Clostridia bacterium]
MKILLTTDVYNVKTNGVATSVRNLYEALLELGHDVRIITLSNDDKSHRQKTVYYVKSASLERIYSGIRMPRSLVTPFLNELIEWKPDIIHSQCEVFSYTFAKKISKKTGAPIVHTYHTMYDDYVGYIIPFKRFGRWIIRKLTKARLKNVDVIITPTYKVEKAMKSYGLKNEIEIIPSGIDLDQHKQILSNDERVKMRDSFNIKQTDVLFISLGRVAPEKKIDELIRHFSKLCKLNEQVYLMVAGDGPSKEGLQQLSRELGIEDRVIFTGMIDPSKVHLYYQIADVFASASTSETQGLTFIEAMANGLPLLCKKDDCLGGVLLDGLNGFFFENEDSFIDGAYKLLDKGVRHSQGNKSRELSCSYDKLEFGKTLEKLYKRVLKKHAE